MLSDVVLFSVSILSAVGHADAFAQPEVSRYTPVPGGWQIRISDDAAAQRPQPGSDIGVAEGDCRLHRRPLYPPADRTMIWTPEELAKIPRSSFRPVVVAYNEPRFCSITMPLECSWATCTSALLKARPENGSTSGPISTPPTWKGG